MEFAVPSGSPVSPPGFAPNAAGSLADSYAAGSLADSFSDEVLMYGSTMDSDDNDALVPDMHLRSPFAADHCRDVLAVASTQRDSPVFSPDSSSDSSPDSIPDSSTDANSGFSSVFSVSLDHTAGQGVLLVTDDDDADAFHEGLFPQRDLLSPDLPYHYMI